MRDISRPIDVTSFDGDSFPCGRVLYFDTNSKTANLTSAGLRLAGYSVDVIQTREAADMALTRSAHGSRPFSIIVVDAISDPEGAEAIVETVEAQTELGKHFPLVILTERSRPTPFPTAAGHACLKRPFATPSLVQLVRHMIGDPDIQVTGNEASAPAPGARRVMTVGGYELIAEIARGGMGTVYLCRKSGEGGFRRFYAMKILHPHLADQEDFVTMLVDEARLASRIHHPNVAAVVDLGHDDMGHFVVMEYVEGPALSQLLKKSIDRRPPALLVPMFIEVLEGLHAAHTLEDELGRSLNLVHRDVSPQNILLGIDGRARLADFGVAKARARQASTRDGVLKGKLAYLAPELLMDDETIDARADVFALGAVMWSVLTGRRLFLGESEAKTIRNILEMEVPLPSTIGLRPPACLDAIICKALERDPNARFQSAQEMADELRRIGSKHELIAPPSKVGAWVKQLFEMPLRERRNAIRLAQSAVAEATSVTRSSSEVMVLSDPAAPVETIVEAHASIPVSTPPRRGRALPIAAGLIGLLAIGAAVAVVTTRDADPEVAESTPASTAPVLEPAKAAEPAPPSVPAAPTPAAAAPDMGESPAAPSQRAPAPSEPAEVEESSAAPSEVDPGAAPSEPQPAAAPPKPAPIPRRRTKKKPRKPDKAPAPAPKPATSPIEKNPYR